MGWQGLTVPPAMLVWASGNQPAQSALSDKKLDLARCLKASGFFCGRG